MVGINTGSMDAMLGQLRSTAARASGSVTPPEASVLEKPAGKVEFGDLLRNSIDQINGVQKQAEDLGKKFALGDDSVDLAEVMIATQKASIGFQATVQVRNKLVSAYHDIMAIQV